MGSPDPYLRSAYAEWINSSRALAQAVYNGAMSPKAQHEANKLFIPTQDQEDPLVHHLRLQSRDLFVRQSHAQTTLLLLEEKSYWRKRVESAIELLPTSPVHKDWNELVVHLATEKNKSWAPFTQAMDDLEEELIRSEHLLPERLL